MGCCNHAGHYIPRYVNDASIYEKRRSNGVSTLRVEARQGARAKKGYLAYLYCSRVEARRGARAKRKEDGPRVYRLSHSRQPAS